MSLAIAVTMMVGVTVMVESFRQTVQLWVDKTVRADVYVTSRSWSRALDEADFDPAVMAHLEGLEGVRAADKLRRWFALYRGQRFLVNALDLGLGGGASRSPVKEGPADAATLVRRPGTCLVSEPFQRRFGVGVGDTLTLDGVAGPVELEVLAVYYDYTTDAGEVTIHLDNVAPLRGAGPPSTMSLHLEPGVEPDQVIDRIRATFPDLPLWLRSNRTLREEVFRIFDQTFQITRFLQLMALTVAACLVALTLLVLARERTRELALYAALGATPRQVFAVFLGKGLWIAGVGLALGGLGGLGLAGVLIHVVNPAFFGWTIQAHLPGPALLEQAATILAAAALASLYPALRASRTSAGELTREDV